MKKQKTKTSKQRKTTVQDKHCFQSSYRGEPHTKLDPHWIAVFLLQLNNQICVTSEESSNWI